MRKRYLRGLVLSTFSLLTVLAPCLAVVEGSPCAMAGCGDSPTGKVRASACCCEPLESSASAETSSATFRSADSHAGTNFAPAGLQLTCQACRASCGTPEHPTSSIPLYVLNSSLLR